MSKSIEEQRKGNFSTPELFIKEAYKYISEELGENWNKKDSNIVWDCSCGEANLTRNLEFTNLYLSTLEQKDIDFFINNNYNPKAIYFQFDFLNDINLSTKLPDEYLIADLKLNKEVIFLINPPYATSTDNNRTGKEKSGVSKTEVNKSMLEDKMGLSSRQLYCQFLYRILKIKQEYNLSNVTICIFSPISFIVANSYKKFMEKFEQEFNFQKGFIFRASNFDEVTSKWNVGFTIWSSSKPKKDYVLDIKEVERGNIVNYGVKKLFRAEIPLGESIQKNYKNLVDAPQMSSALKYKQEGKGKWLEGSFGFFFNGSNNIGSSEHNMGIFSSPYSNNQGFSITKENFRQVIECFTAKKVVKSNWTNWQDEFSSPNINHPEFQQFSNDAIVYSLFETKSNQSSLRNILYKNKLYDIKNEFFWMSKLEMEKLALKHEFFELYQDALKSENERYVYILLKELKLSEDALEVLDLASDLVRESFIYREEFHLKNPDYHLDSFDCGYSQIKTLCKEFIPEKMKEFRNKYKQFEKRLYPIVFELELLRK